MIRAENLDEGSVTYLKSPLGPIDQLEYMVEMAEQLRIMAQALEAGTLAHAFDLAAMEAELQRKLRLEVVLDEIRD